MMTSLDTWIKRATRHLSKESIAQVRIEIQEHHELAREAAMQDGASADEADSLAIAALGDPKLANRQYRKVLLTSSEARMLHNGSREVQAVCSRPWLRRLMQGFSIAVLLAAITTFLIGGVTPGLPILFAGVAIALLLATPLLPIYTPPRARIVRCLKWLFVLGTLAVTFGPDALKWSWLWISCLWLLVWTEWVRASIRRKLPVAQWPKQLYL
jgi:hypothetical protein